MGGRRSAQGNGATPAGWLTAAIEAAPFGVLVHDGDGRVLLFNRHLEQITGYGRGEVPTIADWIEKAYPDAGYRRLVLAARRHEAPQGGVRVREAIVTAKDGRRLHCRFTSLAAQGAVRTVLIEELPAGGGEGGPASAPVGPPLLDQPIPMFIWARRAEDFRLVSLNRAAESLLGAQALEARGRRLSELVEPPGPAARALAKCIDGRTTVPASLPMQLPGERGKTPIDCTFAFLPPENAVMYIANWAQLVRTRDSLRKSELRFRQLVDMLPIVIFETDAEGRMTFWNKAGLEILGYGWEELKGKSAVEMVVEEDRERARANMLHVLRGGEGRLNEYTAIARDGRRVPMMLRSRPIERGGKVDGLWAFAIDVSERKRTEQALREAKEALERRVAERTAEIEHQRAELAEVNTALRVLLREREQEFKALVEDVRRQARQLVLPYLERLASSGLGERQQAWVELASRRLAELAPRAAAGPEAAYRSLSPAEVHVAVLIKEGRTSKEVAAILGCSVRTVESHRKSIRRKLGLQNQKTNLRAYLSAHDIG